MLRKVLLIALMKPLLKQRKKYPRKKLIIVVWKMKRRKRMGLVMKKLAMKVQMKKRNPKKRTQRMVMKHLRQ